MTRPQVRIVVRWAGLLSAMLLAGTTLGCGRNAAGQDVAARRELFATHDPLSAVRLAAHIDYLAHPDRAGRFPGTPGVDAAERYIAERMAVAGLEPAPGRTDFDHRIDLYRSDYDPNATFVRVSVAGAPVAPAAVGGQLRPLFLSDAGSVRAPLVYAGYGITAPEHEWEDYAGLDVLDRIVLVLRYEPAGESERSRFAGAELSNHALFQRKADMARGRGAVGMIVVTGPAHHDGPEDLRTVRTLGLEPHSLASRSPQFRIPGFVAVQVSQGAARRMLEPSAIDLAQLQRETDAGLPPKAVGLGDLTAEVSVGFGSPSELVAARNVVGVLWATEPVAHATEPVAHATEPVAHATEPVAHATGAPRDAGWIVIGAHHDHLGSFGPGPEAVYHGADDNASGVAVLLELAAHFARVPRRHNLAFVTFTAEEEGMLGSRAFVRDGVIPTGEIELMINLDMLGRNPDEPLRAYVPDSAAAYRPVLLEAAAELQVPLTIREGVVEAVSDHYPFHQAGLPVISLFTGLHEDYHQATDTADRLHYDRIAAIGRLVVALIEAVGR